jgi:hypothetical protein
MVVAAGGIAMAANFGVLGVAGAGDGSVGTLGSDLGVLETTTTAPPQVVVIDQYELVPSTGDPTSGVPAAGAPAGGGDFSPAEPLADGMSVPPGSSAPQTTVASPSHRDDDAYDDEHETDREDEHRTDHDDEHETERDD